MMVLEDRFVVVTECLGVAHGYQEWIIDTWMLNVAKEACEEGRHDVQITQLLHKLSLLNEVMEVSGQINNLCHVMVAVLLISCILDTADKRNKVLICDGKFLK